MTRGYRRDTTRLETRTKECNTSASRRVLKPEGRSESEYGFLIKLEKINKVSQFEAAYARGV